MGHKVAVTIPAVDSGAGPPNLRSETMDGDDQARAMTVEHSAVRGTVARPRNYCGAARWPTRLRGRQP